MESLDSIIDLLDRHHQRATYGAVAALVGTNAQSLMQGRERTPRNSWVVNQKTGLPTNYPESSIHPSLLERGGVLSSDRDLSEWLNDRDWRHKSGGDSR